MEAVSIYTTGEYLSLNETWHVEDSPWKADQIYKMVLKNNLRPHTVLEIGCGVGAILKELSRKAGMEQTKFDGYDISPQAIALAKQEKLDRVSFFCEDLTEKKFDRIPDLLLVIDVFEHVPDYWGFVSKCRISAHYKIYHIPLDINISSVMRDTFDHFRRKLGHIHVFSAASALSTLRDTGHEILDVRYTSGAIDLFQHHPSIRRALVIVPRYLVAKFSVPLSARIFGGYSLLVLAK
jgi:SAM-dependent methyltransferase